MDPFTIAASVAKITSSCLVTGKAIYDISCKYQDAPRNMVAISSEMTVVSASLSHIQTLILSKEDSESLFRSRPEITATLDTALTGCMVLFSCLDEEIKNVTKHARRPVAFSWRGKIEVAWKHETFQELLDGIRGQQLAISTLIQLLQADSLLEITKLLQRNAPELQKTVERTHSLRLSHPEIEVAMSLYNQEGQDSLYAATECFQAPSELEFDFDDIVVNSAAYRRALVAAQRQIPITQQDDSGGLANVLDDVESPHTISESTHVRALQEYSNDNPFMLSVREGDIFEILMETPNGWSYGRMDGVAGWLPSNYCEIMPPPSDHAQEALNGLQSVATVIDEPHLEEEEEGMQTEPTEEVRLAFKKLCEEKTAEYVQIIQVIQAEKRQRIAEYAARQSELDRLREEHKRDTELQRQAREEYERQRKEVQQRTEELLEAQKADEARKAEEDRGTLGALQ